MVARLKPLTARQWKAVRRAMLEGWFAVDIIEDAEEAFFRGFSRVADQYQLCASRDGVVFQNMSRGKCGRAGQFTLARCAELELLRQQEA